MQKQSLSIFFLLTALSAGCNNASQSASLAQDEENTVATDALTQAAPSVVAATKHQDRCLTVTSNSATNGTRLTLKSCASDETQLFRPTANGALGIQNSLCLDVVDGKDTNGTPVQLWACSTTNTNQKWEPAENGIWRWKGKNKCLDIVDGNFKDNARLQIWDCDKENPNQQWRFFSPNRLAISVETGTILAQLNNLNTELPRSALEKKSPMPSGTSILFGNNYSDGLCLDVHDIETSPYVQVYQCHNTFSQQFNTTPQGLIQFPAVDIVVDAKKTIKANSYCLNIDTSDPSQGPVAGLGLCDTEDSTQIWNQIESRIQNESSSTCLGVDPWGENRGRVALSACDSSPAISWTLGTMQEISANAIKVASMTDVSSASRPWIQVIDRTFSSDATRRLITHFGGADELAKVIQNAYLKNNLMAYQSAASMPKVKTLKVIFDRFPGTGYQTGSVTNPTIYFNSDVNSNDGIDASLVHELAHVTQRGYGLPFAAVEGYADWLMYKSGFTTARQKVKGGNWTQGYTWTLHFFLWIDTQYISAQKPQPFAIKMNQQAYVSELSRENNWFEPWVVKQTGKTIDALWAEYQKSF